MNNRRRLLNIILFVCISWLPHSAFSKENTLSIFAASSVKDALENVALLFEEQCACETRIAFGASGTMARQVASGAPVDVFISADRHWMQWLRDKVPQLPSATTIFGNSLVVAGSKSLPDLKDLNELHGQRIAIGEPRSVPAGRYAQAALQSLGIWDKVKRDAVRTENVRVALAMVSRGILSYAIVYASDVKVAPELRPVFRILENLHPKIVYQAIVVDNTSSLGAQFKEFLVSTTARKVFSRFGFRIGPEQN